MANDKNAEVFNVEIAYGASGEKETLDAARDLDKVLDDLREGVNIDIDVDQSSAIKKLTDLDGAAIDTKITVDDAGLTEAKRKHDDIDEPVSTEINADGADIRNIKDDIDALRNLQVIEIGINVGGKALEFIQGVSDFVTDPFFQYDSALGKIEARTGNMLPDARELIGDLYTDGWGESRDQITDVIVAAEQLEVTQDRLGESIETAFQVAAVSGGDATEAMRTLDAIVDTGLIPTIEEAGDLLVTGFQEGANAGGDLGDTLIEFGPKFDQLRISGPAALALIKTGLDNGAKGAETIADGIKELGNNLTQVGSDPNITSAFQELDNLSTLDLSNLLDLYRQGKISGDDFFQGVTDALGEAGTADPARAQRIAETLIGSKAEDFGYEVFAGLSTNAQETFGEIEGRADEAGLAIRDNMSTKFMQITRSIQEGVLDLLENNVGVQDFLDNLEQGVEDTLQALKDGKSLGEALTIGLKPLGFDDEFQKLESIFGNLYIIFLEIVRDIGNLLGKDTSVVQKQLSAAAGNQLAFDLQVANADEIAGVVQTALERGVSGENVVKAASTAVNEALEAGSTEQAQAIVNGLGNTGAILNATGFEPVKIPVFPDMSQEDYQTFINERAQEFQNQTGVPVKVTFTEIDQGEINDLQDKIDDALASAQTSTAASDDASTVGAIIRPTRAALDDLATTVSDVGATMDIYQQNATDYEDAIASASAVNSGFAGSFGEMVAAAQTAAADSGAAMDTVGDKAIAMDADVTEAITGNSVVTEFETMAVSADKHIGSTVNWVNILSDAIAHLADVTPFIFSVTENLSALSTAATAARETTQAAVNAAQNNALAGAQGGSFTQNNSNVNTTIYASSDAQAQAAGLIISNEARGF